MLDLGQYLGKVRGIFVVAVDPGPMTSAEMVVIYWPIARDLMELLIGQLHGIDNILLYRGVAKYIHIFVARLESAIGNLGLIT